MLLWLCISSTAGMRPIMWWGSCIVVDVYKGGLMVEVIFGHMNNYVNVTCGGRGYFSSNKWACCVAVYIRDATIHFLGVSIYHYFCITIHYMIWYSVYQLIITVIYYMIWYSVYQLIITVIYYMIWYSVYQLIITVIYYMIWYSVYQLIIGSWTEPFP